jgi:DNA polymerase alpha subunit p180 N terminal
LLLGLVGQRTKRRKVEKKSASAFEKLRELKQGGTRDKWAAEESTKIYDEVDEEEYTKIVSSRSCNWIVDDGEPFDCWRTT